MKTIQSLWTDFEITYSNHPVPFEDEIFGDGNSTKYQISFYPIYDLASALPVVTINTGTIPSPVWETLDEGIDYVINYQNWEIIFQPGSIPKELLDSNGDRVATAKVNAYHCKINLKQFLEFWNNSRQHMTQWFPIRDYREVTATDMWVPDNTEIFELDYTVAPFTDFYRIEEFFQDKDGKKHLPFYKRGKMFFFDSPNSEWPVNYPVGPTDYWRWPMPARRGIRPPFWVHGMVKYPYFDLTVDPNTYLGSDTLLEDNASTENVMMRLALLMYRYRLHFSERMNASTLRMSTMKEVQGMVMGLSMDLQQHTAQFAPGSGTIAPNDITN
jgi:hypothetical protein